MYTCIHTCIEFIFACGGGIDSGDELVWSYVIHSVAGWLFENLYQKRMMLSVWRDGLLVALTAAMSWSWLSSFLMAFLTILLLRCKQIDWCCLNYSLRNSLAALLKALFPRIDLCVCKTMNGWWAVFIYACGGVLRVLLWRWLLVYRGVYIYMYHMYI